MNHTTLKRSVAVEAIESLKEVINDWRIYQQEYALKDSKGINDIISNYETVIAALEGDTITIED